MRVTRSSEDTGFKPTQLFGFIGWKGMATLLCDGLREPRHDRPAMPFPIIRILSLNILDAESTEKVNHFFVFSVSQWFIFRSYWSSTHSLLEYTGTVSPSQ